ncbi:F-box domain-containing protein [Diaporthe amygdali]|uniref:F-box domain-containing protein n=1 Tax=Phomopsis amygdali TaxID=1214568 RepID=UPI0022FEDB90|nr:F-box domain-containing protein [Diaporthe amygdali]KAJ0121722.1 F-box domain-containing protein [Diaporthe amygdali]
MDPPHITEFASKRYFEKINQLPKDHQPQPQQHNDSTVVETSSSRFILPIRGAEQQGYDPQARHVEQIKQEKEKERERRSLFGFGRLRGPKPTNSTPESQVPTLRRPSIVSDASASSIAQSAAARPKSLPFDQLFLSLPNELQIQIIAYLPLSDVLNLRRASKAWHHMITVNEFPIVRHQLQHEIPAYAKRLYPVSDTSGYTLHYLCGLWHRLHVAAKLSGLMCDWCTKEIFLKTTKDQIASFAAQRERMYRRLIPLLFTIFHFFENYRKLHLQYVQEHGHGIERTPYTLNPIETQIMSMYDDRTLLHVHQVFPLVVASFCRRLRPPSYVGRVERTVRGYLREKPADEVHTAVLCLGGLRQVLRLWEVRGYNTRRGAVDTWYNNIQEARESPKTPEASKETKSRRGIMSLGRRKSNWQVRDASRADEMPELPNRGSLEHTATRRSTVTQPSLVFHTSLAAGMPMDWLEQDQYKLLLPDLPVLQKLWLSTAEAMILDRKIVERSVDIKRNAQVMLDLIKEDGGEGEDLWWYETIQPPREAIEEDTLE